MARPRRHVSQLFATTLVAAGFLVAGCAEAPALEVRWGFVESVEARDEGAEPTTLQSALDCSASGVAQVALQVYTEDGDLLVGTRIHGCYPRSFANEDKLARLPTIDTPGTYQLRVVGLRGNAIPFEREVLPSSLLAGENIPAPEPLKGWDCEELERSFIRIDNIIGADNQLGEVATPVTYGFQHCALAQWPPIGDEDIDNRFTVDEEGNPSFLDLDGADRIPLVRPLACDDGIDNDGDGLVDGADLACQVDNTNAEGDDKSLTIVRALAGFFGTPLITCDEVDAGSLELSVKDGDGEIIDTFTSDPCKLRDPSLQIGPVGLELASGDYTLEGVVLGPGGGDAITEVKSAGPFTVPEDGGGVFVTTFDFDNVDFLEPFVTGLGVFLSFQPSPANELRTCAHTGSKILSIDTVEVQLADNTDMNNPLLDVSVPCVGAGAFAKLAEDEMVSWAEAKYYASAQAKTGNQVCYRLDARPLGPNPGEQGQIERLQRITNEDGTPIEGCVECVQKEEDEPSDCLDEYTCDNGFCNPPSANGG